VTGGIGSEKLTGYRQRHRSKSEPVRQAQSQTYFTGEIGIDHYTSASSDKIDPKTISSASHADTRFYPSFGWTMENEKKEQLWAPAFLIQVNSITNQLVLM
jgi:hypothetical protein